MGRGRGRGGGGGGGGRGGGRSGGRGKSRKHVTHMSRKESSHLHQFGEKHPAEEMQDFQPKKFKADYDRGRGRGRGHDSFRSREKVESSESESEDEATPYTELLGIFTGQMKKKKVLVVSESEEDEEENEPEKSGEENTDECLDSDEEIPRSSKTATDTLEQDKGAEKPVKDMFGADNADDEQTDVVDETVIEEAELDPDFYDGSGKNSSTIDPFLRHFEREMSEGMQELVKDNKLYSFQKEYEWTSIGRFRYFGMSKEKVSDSEVDKDKVKEKKEVDLSEVKVSRILEIPDPPQNSISPCGSTISEDLFIKSQLQTSIPDTNKAFLDVAKQYDSLTALQNEILTLAGRYYDLYFPERSLENTDEIRLAYCIHAANHILKTRTRIIHHNAKMAEKNEVPEEFRDQGFVRPKVLILTPFKESALKIVKVLISLLLPKDGTVQNKKRLITEYGGETLFMPKTNPKPEDYMATFTGNVDDNFKIGLALTKKCIKLYSGFYSSDIIIASPLGLRMIVGAEGEKSRDFDFLSSVEVLIADQADVFLMQNWDHVLHLMKHLHLQPVTTHGTDFGRIRPWALDSLTRNYCQTLVFSSIICPEHNALFSRYCKNYAGLVKVGNPIVKTCISQITVQLPQVFQQFDCPTFQEASDARFKYFVETVLPTFSPKLMSHTLIYVSSYFDFVRLRNYFKREKTSFVQICEYTKDKKIARARDYFFHGQNHFLLYTERAHFFRRFRLKGVGHIIFYQLPQYAHFYSELCNLMQDENQIRRVRQRRNNSVNVIYCKYDASRLAPIVGTQRANYMLSSDKTVHAFVSSEGEV